MRSRRWAGAVATGAALSVLSAGPAQAAKLVDLGRFLPDGLNGSDQVVGNIYDATNQDYPHAGVWHGGTLTPLPELAGSTNSDALAINAAGRIGGDDKSSGSQAVFWDLAAGTGTLSGPTPVGTFPPTTNNYGYASSVDGAGKLVGVTAAPNALRGFVGTPGALSQVGVGSTDPADQSKDTEADAVTPDGSTILGEVQTGGQAYQGWYLFSGASPAAAGAKLDLTPARNGFAILGGGRGTNVQNSLAADGSVLGFKGTGSSKTYYLRPPTGPETLISGLAGHNAINARHTVAGTIVTGNAADPVHAAIWQAGTVTDLNTLLPAGSGFHLFDALAINDNGDIAGVGVNSMGVEHGFLLKMGYVVDSTGDQPDLTPGDGNCLTSAGTCTLRAALQEVNASGSSSRTPITFNITSGVPAGTLATVAPGTPLPAVTKPVELDATTQPGALVSGPRKIGVILDGTGAGGSADGLQLGQGSAGSLVSGLQIQNFAAIGVVMGDSSQQVANCVLTGDGSGVEVAGDNAIVGSGAANQLPGDIFFKDGSLQKAINFIRSNAGKQLTSGQITQSEAGFGAGILLDKSSSGTRIDGDAIGVHGAGFSAAPDQLGPDGFGATSTANVNTAQAPDISPFGVLISSTGGAHVNNVELGAGDAFAGDMIGVATGTDSSSSVSGVRITGAHFGTEPDGSALGALGMFFGVTADGNVSGLKIGAPGSGNQFTSSMIAVLLSGRGLSSPSVQANTFGASQSLGSLDNLDHTNLFAVLLADVNGAQIGGTTPGQGNEVFSSAFGITLAGTKNANDTVAGNTIGATSPVPFDPKDGLPDLYGVVGVGDLVPGGAPRSQISGIRIVGNSIQGEGLGVFLTGASGVTMQSNTIGGAVAGALVVSADQSTIGGVGAGNVFENSGFGLLLAGSDPPAAQNAEAGANPSQDSSASRDAYLTQPNEDLALSAVNESSTADLSPTSLAVPATPPISTGDAIIGNRFGVDAAGHAAPNGLPVTIGGTERAIQFGGLGAGQGNLVLDNRAEGLVLFGNGAASPQAQILGNTIYNNENFTLTTATGLHGLGIDLLDTRAGFGNGVNRQDPVQPDSGPDSLQNAPVLHSATTGSGQLRVSGKLHGAKNTRYLLELYADQNQNPFGAGEGETLLARPTLITDAAGDRSFSASVPAPNKTYRFVSATATTVPAQGLGVTSEFSVNARIRPASPTAVTTAGGTATTSGSTVTLPVQVTCSSAQSTSCTVSSSASLGSSGTSADVASLTARRSAAVRRNRHPRGKGTIIGRGHQRLRAGAKAKVKLVLTRSGFAHLMARHVLRVKLVVSVTGRHRSTVRRTLSLRLRYVRKPGRHHR